MLRLISLLIIALFTSCQSSSIQNRELEEIYISGGTEKFYLADIPVWANFSSIGQCHRVESTRYLNFDNLSKNYALSYEQLLQFQYMLNRKFKAFKKTSGKKQLFLKDESYLFYNTYEQIIGGARDFFVPNYSKINLVWIDNVINDQEMLKKFKRLMNSAKMQEGHPVLVSTCLSSEELEKFILEHNLDRLGVKGISYEFFSPYSEDMNLVSEFRIHFDKLMPGKFLVLFAPWFPKEFVGIDKIEKF